MIFDAKHKYKSNWKSWGPLGWMGRKSPFGADETFKIQCRFYHDDELVMIPNTTIKVIAAIKQTVQSKLLENVKMYIWVENHFANVYRLLHALTQLYVQSSIADLRSSYFYV